MDSNASKKAKIMVPPSLKSDTGGTALSTCFSVVNKTYVMSFCLDSASNSDRVGLRQKSSKNSCRDFPVVVKRQLFR